MHKLFVSVFISFTLLSSANGIWQLWQNHFIDERLREDPIESDQQCEDVRYADKCYYFGLNLEWWIGAQEQCRKIGYQLVQIKTIDEANFLARHLKNTAFRYFWLDATDEGHEGLWIAADNKPAFLGFWNPQEPNGERWENCGELTISDSGLGRMNDQDCQKWRKYICQRKTNLICPRGGYQERCYWFSMHPSNWFQAREHCQSLGMRMARVGGADQLQFIAQHMESESSWVDVRYGASMSGGLTFSDGMGLSSNWQYGNGMQPAVGAFYQRCGEVRTAGTLEGRISGADCQSMRHFVCERAPLAPSSVGTNHDDILGLPSGLSSSSAAGRRKRNAENRK